MKKYCSFILFSFLIILTFGNPIKTFADSSTIEYGHIPIEGVIGKVISQNQEKSTGTQQKKIEGLPNLGSEEATDKFLSFSGIILILIVGNLYFLQRRIADEKE